MSSIYSAAVSTGELLTFGPSFAPDVAAYSANPKDDVLVAHFFNLARPAPGARRRDGLRVRV